MSGVPNFEQEPEVIIPDEKVTLKAQADKMGIKYSPNIGVAKLRERIQEALGQSEGGVTQTDKPAVQPNPAPLQRNVATKSVAQLKQEHNVRLRKDAMKLVRIVVNCMNPNKKDIPGEIFTVGNAVVGTVRKYVPFNVEAGYHVPHIIYQQLKDRKYQSFAKKKMPGGRDKIENKLLPEFNIQVLDPLTKAEMKELAQRQALNHSIDED